MQCWKFVSRFMLLTVYPKKYAHGFCFAVLCCGYTLTDFPISIRLTSLALWQSNDCPSASKATLMNMDKYFMWIHYERLHTHNKAKHYKTVCIFLGIYCRYPGACACQKQLSRAGTRYYITQIIWDVLTCHCVSYLFWRTSSRTSWPDTAKPSNHRQYVFVCVVMVFVSITYHRIYFAKFRVQIGRSFT